MIRKFFVLCLTAAASCLPVLAQSGNYNPEEAMKALGALLGGGGAGGGGQPVETIHFRQLKGVLPSEYKGMERTNIEAGKNSAMGLTMSYAEADYEGDGGRITIRIQDIGAMSGYMRMAQFAWANQEMERESSSGYERTTKIEGFPAMEEYNKRSRNGELQIMVGDRLMVDVNGYDMEMDTIKQFVKDLGLKKLAAMKPESAE